jgi:hypothetical protein
MISGETRSAEIEVRVQFAPSVVSIGKSVIKSGRGVLVELSCLVNGEPQPKIVWYKGDEVKYTVYHFTYLVFENIKVE